MKEREATRVDVHITLANGSTHSFAWMTPVSFGRSLAKGIAWAKRDMRANLVPGRSNIVGVEASIKRTGKSYKKRKGP